MQRIKNYIYQLVGAASRTARSDIQKRTLLIIKTDEIGDYVLWRNMLPCIRNSDQYRNYRITLLGNAAWKELATSFDSQYADEFIWLDKKKFKSDMRYRYQFLKKVRSHGFETVVNCIFSRSPRVDDAIVSVCNKSHKIGMRRNEHNVAPFETGYDVSLYQEIHDLPLTRLFEFDRNKKFTAAFLHEDCHPEFGFEESTIQQPPKGFSDYAVIFPGSGRKDRRWTHANFADVALYLHFEKGLNIVLAGGQGDREACREVSSLLFNVEVIDLSGQTSLPQFVALLKNAKLLVSVDTGAVHLAAASGCAVYGLFNGDQYGRFAPYPSSLLRAPFYAIYPDGLEKKLSGEKDVFEKYQYFSGFDVNEISPEKVIGLLSNA